MPLLMVRPLSAMRPTMLIPPVGLRVPGIEQDFSGYETPFLILAAFLAAAPAQAKECQSPANVVAIVRSVHPDAEQIAHFMGVQVIPFVAYYNAMPPVTTYEADEVMLFVKPDITIALLVLLENGCSVASEEMPLYLAFQMIAEARRGNNI